MGPKKADGRSTRSSTRPKQAQKTNPPSSTPRQRVPQNAPAVTNVPRPAVWEPVVLHDEAEWIIDKPEYFDEISERLASLFARRPKGWKTKRETEADPKKSALEDVARTHAYYGRLKVYKQAPDGDGWSKEADFDDEWHAERLLGAGTYGRVGLWVRRDKNGQIVDEMAIKEEDYDEVSTWKGGLPEEAVFNEIMNRGGVENIQRLRGFKSFATPSDNPVLRYEGEMGDRRWRYYFEYAPHGTLERLIARYRAWGQYLPESFIWHVFDGLAQVLVTFDETVPNPKEYGKSLLRVADRLVHFDIKPTNIFLGYEQPCDVDNKKYGGHQSNVYPMVKIGDFGVASMTSEKDPDQTQGRFWGRGTKYYLPPEQMHYGLGFPVPPNGKYLPLQNEQGQFIAIETRQSNGNPAGILFAQPMNVWGVGKVMYDLATLSHDYDYAGISTQKPDEYEKWNKNAIEDFQRDPFLASNHAKNKDDTSLSPYTKDLMSLIEQCMKPTAAIRIKARDIKTITEKMLARYGSDNGLEMNEKVYFRGNEINGMQAGPEDFPYFEGPAENTLRRCSMTEIDDLMEYSVDPNESELQPPRWQEQMEAYKASQKKKAAPYNKYWQNNCRIENGKVIFRSNPTVGAGSGSPDDQDDPDNNAIDANGEAVDEEPVKVSEPKAPPKKPAGKGEFKKGVKSQTKPTKGATGARVTKTAAKRPATSKPVAPKPAAKPAAKKNAPKKPAAQAAPATTNNAPQAQTGPPRGGRLPRAAKAKVSPGKYKV